MTKLKNAALTVFFLVCMVPMVAGAAPEAEAQVFAQDLTIHSTTTSPGMMGRGGGTAAETEYYSKNAVKTSSADGTDSIIRFDLEKFISIDNKKKTYSEMTFKQVQEILNKAGEEMEANAEDMAAIKKMMGAVTASFTVTNEGPGEQIAGYATQKYRIRGPMDMEIWTAPSLKIPAAYYDMLKFRTPSNPMFDMRKLYEEMKKIDGIPLKTVMSIKMMGTEMKTTKVVTSVDKGAVPASVFEIPPGYKLVPFK